MRAENITIGPARYVKYNKGYFTLFAKDFPFGLVPLNGNLSKWILNNMPEEMTPEWVHFLGEVMHHVAEEMVERKGQPDKPESG